jgi:uncharacterized protein YwbE
LTVTGGKPECEDKGKITEGAVAPMLKRIWIVPCWSGLRWTNLWEIRSTDELFKRIPKSDGPGNAEISTGQGRRLVLKYNQQSGKEHGSP